LQSRTTAPTGLHAAVFSADSNRALEVARKLDTGTVGVNCVFTPASAPFGGLKASGIGRECGPEGYDSFLEYVTYTLTSQQAEALRGRLPIR
jgi:aldehyde dehydrogenase (NAD+)